MTTVSVDLAYRSYRDFGMALLEEGASGAVYELVPFASGRNDTPSPETVADVIITECEKSGSKLALLDGPQGWKDPANGLEHSRRCERELNAPGKTGLPGNTKPKNYYPFIDFSVRVFDALHARGWQRFNPALWRPDQPTVVESLPLSAWRSLGLPCLPAKRKSSDAVILDRLDSLVRAALVVSSSKTPTHDQLQALVAGLAGTALMTSATARYEAIGVEPAEVDGIWREGYIVNPKRLCAKLPKPA